MLCWILGFISLTVCEPGQADLIRVHVFFVKMAELQLLDVLVSSVQDKYRDVPDTIIRDLVTKGLSRGLTSEGFSGSVLDCNRDYSRLCPVGEELSVLLRRLMLLGAWQVGPTLAMETLARYIYFA